MVALNTVWKDKTISKSAKVRIVNTFAFEMWSYRKCLESAGSKEGLCVVIGVAGVGDKLKMCSTLPDFVTADGPVTVFATVPTGFESTACEEIKEKLFVTKYEIARGKVFFETTSKFLSKCHMLHSVDNLFLVIKNHSGYVYDVDREKAILDIKNLPLSLPWDEVVKFWKENLKYCTLSMKTRKNHVNKSDVEPVSKKLDTSNNNKSDNSLLEKQDKEGLKSQSFAEVRYRATANRVGKKQSITSPDAEVHFGGAVQDVTNWKVDLSNYNLEIMITLGEDYVLVALALTLQSLHRRNITHFGSTTLRASIAYNMLRMCNIQPGEIVIDPMCGTGAIPIEGCDEWKSVCYVAGDKSHVALDKCVGNIASLNKYKMKSVVEVMQWDVRKLPWRNGLIDVCVSDLPFGKRVGSKIENRELYPVLLQQLAKVMKTETARACLLTRDKRSIVNAISMVSCLWKLHKTTFINIGGLRAGVYLLRRTSNAF